jgi:ATP-dependent Clp protease adaptor protein ClpS
VGKLFLTAFLCYTGSMPYAEELVRKKREKLKEPDDYWVILLNDNFTTMDFVVEILMMVFHKKEEDATRIMLDVHQKGKGLIGTYPFDIAQTKANQVHDLARQYEFPLKCIIEKA